jgi:DNA excision repair protein ERCC-2
MKPVLSKFKNVVFISNTLQPIDYLPKVLGFAPRVRSFHLSLPLNTFGPFLMTKGADQLEVCTKHDQRENTGVVRNFGSLLVEMSSIVPDGILCYFPTYKYMEFVLIKWNESGIL